MASTLGGRQLTEVHRRAQVAIGAQTVTQMGPLWSLVRDQANVDGWLTAAVPVLSNQYGLSAATARGYYNVFRQAEAGLPSMTTLLAPEINRDAVRASLVAKGPAVLKDALHRGLSWEQAMSKAEVSAARESVRLALGGGRDQIISAVESDTVALGWSRTTDGSPCAFCALLASRGPVYKSEGAADFRSHASCGCGAEPVFTADQEWPGRSREFADLYSESTRGEKDKLNAFRRAYEARKAGLAPPTPPTPSLPPSAPSVFSEKQLGALQDLATGRFDPETFERVREALSESEQGEALFDFLDKWQNAETSGRYRNQIEQYLSGGLTGPASRRVEALFDAMDEIKVQAPESLHRGMAVKGKAENIIAQYNAGDTLDLNLSSFTADSATASRYARQRRGNMRGNSTEVIVEWVGAKQGAIPIQNVARDSFHFKQKEWVGGGQFKIVDVKKVHGGRIKITIEQEASLSA